MQQIVQDIHHGRTVVRSVPPPICAPGHVLIANAASLISAGTERYVVELARKSIVGKLRDRPDHARRMMQKIRDEGIRAAVSQAQAKLDEPMPLGYSSAGIVLEAGRGVQEFKPGDAVASAGAHAAVVSLGRNLCACIPDGVSFEQAAYTSVAAVGLQGLRLASLTLGHRVLIIGLGLIGQICVALAKAHGCAVFATDVDPEKLALAQKMGADQTGLGSPVDAVLKFADSKGVDAVIITAATKSNEPIEFAADACRPRGRIVLVGVTGLNVPRAPFFKKELEFTVSSSLGPGRGDPSYEQKGIDYPIGHARWTAQRNMRTVLELMASGRLPVQELTTHRYQIEQAAEAYDLIGSKRERYLGVVVTYPGEPPRPTRRVTLASARQITGDIGVALIGGGNFARLIMSPILRKLPGITWRGICTANGMNAEDLGRKMNFGFATSDVAEIWNDSQTSAVFIATRHDLHADLVIAALQSGKHTFVEKPVCITEEELERIRVCVEDLGDRCPILMVGFNRRFASATQKFRTFFQGLVPKTISYRFAAGAIPREHWTQDEDVGGGRIVGEASHAIDTCVALAESVPQRVYAESVGGQSGLEVTDDKVFITLRHANGSISNISYQSDGPRGFPSERIEVFGGGRAAVNDSWSALQFWDSSGSRKESGGREKGHAAEFEAFLDTCRKGGNWPIPWDELYGVAWSALMAVRSIREGVPFGSDSVIESDWAGIE